MLESRKLVKADCGVFLSALADPTVVADVVKKLSQDEQRLLGIFRLYGGTMTAATIGLEIAARGLTPSRSSRSILYRDDPYLRLLEKCLIISRFSDRRKFLVRPSSTSGGEYFETTAHPIALTLVPAAEHASWSANCLVSKARSTFVRTFNDFLLDMKKVTTKLHQNWRQSRISHDPLPTSALLVRAEIELPAPHSVPIPEIEQLHYELVRILCGKKQYAANAMRSVPNKLLEVANEEAALRVIDTWLWSKEWMDGVGSVGSERPRKDHMSMVEAMPLRESTVWGLAAVARNEGTAWIDLEGWLQELWRIRRNDTPSTRSRGFAWSPMWRANDVEEELSTWMSGAGRFCANVISGTFAVMGLTECGEGNSKEPFFRLTPLGRTVFG